MSGKNTCYKICVSVCLFLFLFREVWVGTDQHCWINLSMPFNSLSHVVSENLSHCDRSHSQASYCVQKVSGLPWDAVWSMAGCGILQGACHVCSLGLLRLLEQRKGMHIRRTQLFAVPFHFPLLFREMVLPVTHEVHWNSFLLCWYQGSLTERASAWLKVAVLLVWPPWCWMHSAKLPPW